MNQVLSNKPAVLIIGGQDPQGCAGVTADSLTVSNHGCHPLVLVTALTEQSSTGLTNMGAVSADTLMRQFKAIQQDFEISAIKVGLIPTLEVAQVVCEILTLLKHVPVVYDPVLATSSGGESVSQAVQTFCLQQLFPLVDVLTPNLNELAQLAATDLAVEQAANQLLNTGVKHCLVKGGHRQSAFASDYFASALDSFYCYQTMLATGNVRGTGCVLAASFASHLACGQDVRDAVVLSKAYVNRGIRLSDQAGPYRVLYHSQAPIALVDMPKLCYQAKFIGKQFDFPKCPLRLGIYPVVDTADWVKKLVALGVSTIQLRVKDQPKSVLHQEIAQAVENVQGRSVNFFVNDYWQLAIENKAYGVHLGQEDLHDAQLDQIAAAGLRLGVSTHSYWELARALAINPSYIALGPIFETTSKQMPFAPQGEARLQQWVALLGRDYPLVAIGGIDLPRAKQLKKTGVGSVAMISAITKAADYKAATNDLLAAWASS